MQAKSKITMLVAVVALVIMICPTAAFADLRVGSFGGGQADRSDSLLATQSASVSSPRVVSDSSMKCGQLSTWDCVWFGSYPQAEVTPSDPAYASLQSASWDASGDVTVGGAKYRRISKRDVASSDGWPSSSGAYRYFKYEPVKWRVLSVSGSIAYVVSDIALDCQPYNANYVSVSWKTSGIRSWLNGYGASSNQPRTDFTSYNFIGAAFSPGEQSAIVPAQAANSDKVLLLSTSEAKGDAAPAFGFSSGQYATSSVEGYEDRVCRGSDFANAMGAWRDDNGCVNWCLGFPPGTNEKCVPLVFTNGTVHWNTNFGVNFGYSVRPALYLDLSSPYVTYAGTVSSSGSVNETGSTGASRFTDVGYGSGHPHWVVDDGGIDWLSTAVEAGLMGGYSGTTLFGPDDPITRGQVATVLYRASAADASDTTDPARYAANATPFSDVAGGQYYTAAMNWAYAERIFTGDSNGTTVRPGDGITRQELALVLYRYATANGGPALADASCFSGAPDAADVSAWASDGVAWCYENGIMTGSASTRELSPWGGATRAAMCKMAVVTLGLLGDAR